MEHSEKKNVKKTKRNWFRRLASIIYDSFIWNFGISIVMLLSWYFGLLSKHFFQRTQQHDSWKKTQSNDKLQKQPFIGVLIKYVLKICSKFTGKHSCRSVVSIKSCVGIMLLHGCYPKKFAAYFQNTFSQEHLWRTASETLVKTNIFQ